ncbi:hypothetical protein EVAR_4230_1 [Eumeta japonica]|uniref:Uncharacterized protein n=1 Tax=Eumeta variegata TaxID=151549 RepID=A0A4C1TH70_EUMVA|nr:hypothetical protein EVAR_4230_1 [Eumeta japonica]
MSKSATRRAINADWLRARAAFMERDVDKGVGGAGEKKLATPETELYTRQNNKILIKAVVPGDGGKVSSGANICFTNKRGRDTMGLGGARPPFVIAGPIMKAL